MGQDLLGSLAGVLRSVAAAPPPDDIAASIVTGLHDSLGARSAAILAIRPPLLVVYAHAGGVDPSDGGVASIPLDDDHIATRSVREGEVIVEPRDDGRSVAAPLVSAGGVQGALLLACEHEREWSTWDSAAVGAIGAALGMWLSHPDSGLPSVDPRDRPLLTPRQRRILTLAARGSTSPAIAATLGYSTSTVKQEMQRALRLLDADNRSAAIAKAQALGLLDEEGG